MAALNPLLLTALSDLTRGLREMDVDFCVVGALVPELLLNTPPPSMTNDADVTVAVDSREDFEQLKERLADYGFQKTRLPYRLTHQVGGWVDLLPFSEAIAPGGRLYLGEGLDLNMAGFSQVVRAAIQVPVAPGLTLPLAPLPLFALLKLVAFSDRKAPKDLGGVRHCLGHYKEDDDRRYGLHHDATPVPWEYTCAYLIGLDGRIFLDPPVRAATSSVLDQFDSPDARIVATVAGAQGRVFVEDEQRTEIYELFRWFRLGLSS